MNTYTYILTCHITSTTTTWTFCNQKNETKFLYPCETFEKSTSTYTIMFLFPILTGYIWKIFSVYRDSLNIQQRFWKPIKANRTNHCKTKRNSESILKNKQQLDLNQRNVNFKNKLKK